MVEREKVVEAVYQAIDSVNEQLPRECWIEKSLNSALYSKSSTLDSFGLVNLILATEESVADEFGVEVTIADGVAAWQENNPFRTVDSLVQYISGLLEEKNTQ